MMDGQRTVDRLWRDAVARLGDDAPSQDELLQLLSQLHQADLLVANVAPDVSDLLSRGRRQRRSVWLRNLVNPMSLRFRLWDPDAFLTRTLPALRGLFTPIGVAAWLAFVALGLILAAAHWRELSGNLSDRVLAMDNLLLLLVVFPSVKAGHELAHGWAVKAGGGEVHEMGLMFLVLAPVPYVDASASTGFRDKLARAGVAAAGMLAELGLATLAMLLWLLVEPGFVRSIAFNVMLVASVSTLIFNANPLLRYDGYFILCDLIEMPNLGQRATRWWAWFFQRHAFGTVEAEPPDESPAERRILLVYGALSWLYRLMVVFGIAIFIAGHYFFIGVVLGLWGLAGGTLWPLLKGLRHVAMAPELARRRQRALAVTFGGLILFVVTAVWVPMPLSTFAEGVVWVPEQAEIRARSDGIVQHLLVAPGSRVEAGQAVAELDDAGLWADYDAQCARVDRMRIQVAMELTQDRAQAAATAAELEREDRILARLEQRIDNLVLVAGVGGRLLVPRAADLEGRWLRQGSQLGFVLDGALRTARIVVTQQDIGLVRHHLQRLRVRLADRPDEVYEARVVREVPGGSDRLPAKSLSTLAGGRQPVDPSDSEGTKTLNRIFQLEVLLPPEIGDLRLGTRLYARLEHQAEPLAQQAWRRLRQLFLSRFDL
jgi:putative peptide zinc metalloprotease protein